MEVGILNSKSAEVNGTKPKSLCYRRAKSRTDGKIAEQGLILTRLLKSFMGVFRNDFATVDVREELCYHSRPKKQIREGWESQKLLKADDQSEIIACKK